LTWIKKKFRPHYYKYFPFFRPVKALEWDAINKWLKPLNGEIVLDVGSGHGHFARRIWKPGLRVLGVDLNRNGIAIAKKYNSPKGCQFLVADAMHLPFGNKIFDKVMSVCALEHFLDDDLALMEMNRVLKKHGKFVLSVDSLNYRGISTDYKKKCKAKHFTHRLYTKELLVKKLTHSGFRVVEEKYVISSPVSSFAYKASSFFRWKGVDFMEPLIFIITFPISYLVEHTLGLGFKEEGYILAAEALKMKD